MIAAALLLAASSVEVPPDWWEQALEWVDQAKAVDVVNRDIAAKNFRFLCLLGVGCPGVKYLTYRMCYSATARLEEIEGTSDFTHSDRHAYLQEKAQALAAEYNPLVARRLDELGKGCPAGEQWEELERALYDDMVRVAGGYPVHLFVSPE